MHHGQKYTKKTGKIKRNWIDDAYVHNSLQVMVMMVLNEWHCNNCHMNVIINSILQTGSLHSNRTFLKPQFSLFIHNFFSVCVTDGFVCHFFVFLFDVAMCFYRWQNTQRKYVRNLSQQFSLRFTLRSFQIYSISNTLFSVAYIHTHTYMHLLTSWIHCVCESV